MVAIDVDWKHKNCLYKATESKQYFFSVCSFTIIETVFVQSTSDTDAKVWAPTFCAFHLRCENVNNDEKIQISCES